MLHKIYYIAQREFRIRVQKKSFWIMTFVGPVIMACLMVVPLWFTLDKSDSNIMIVSNLAPELKETLPKIDGLTYVENNDLQAPADSVIKWLNADAELRFQNGEVILSSTKINAQNERLIFATLENTLLKMKSGQLELPKCKVRYLQDTSSGRAVQELMSYAMSIAVYFFIFMYGIQVMKGVVEEKNNRIIEVMLCTVKPFDLLMGKIMGISLVGLLQFVIWISLVLGLEALVSSILQIDQAVHVDLNALSSGMNLEVVQGAQAYLSVLKTMSLPLILVSYLWFFFFGFLLYAAYFAVVGSASDVDTDTQQFIFPITVPLFGTLLMSQKILSEPHDGLATCMSFFPLTSPLAMSMRLPFAGELPMFWLQVLVSSLVLFVAFVGFVWVAARIYRIGILSYGAKVGYGQLVKWFFEKE